MSKAEPRPGDDGDGDIQGDERVMRRADQRDKVLNALITLVSASKGLSIAGPGCAGKSTFAAELAGRLRGRGMDAAVLDLDCYLMPRAERARVGLSAYHPDAYDLAGARRDIERLRGGGEVSIRNYDKITGTTRDAGVLVLKDILIIEGALALHDKLRGLSPINLFLDASTETLFENRRRREASFGFRDEEIIQKFAGLQADYKEHVAPQGRYADLRVEVDHTYRFIRFEDLSDRA